jgi:hypothetical protein
MNCVSLRIFPQPVRSNPRFRTVTLRKHRVQERLLTGWFTGLSLDGRDDRTPDEQRAVVRDAMSVVQA